MRRRRLGFAGQRDEPAAPRAREVDQQRVAGRRRTVFDRMPARGALLQLLERLIDGADFEHRRRLAQRDARVLARLDRRQRLEVRHERQRLAFFDGHVPDVGRRDRLEAALAQRVADQARNQVVRDVVQDLVLVALPDDGRRHFARPEAGHARRARIALGHAVDLGVDDVGGNFEGEVLAGLADLGEFGLHEIIMCRKLDRAEGQARLTPFGARPQLISRCPSGLPGRVAILAGRDHDVAAGLLAEVQPAIGDADEVARRRGIAVAG